MSASCWASSSRVSGVQLDAAGARVALELGQQRPQRVAAVQLVRAVGGDHQHALAAQRGARGRRGTRASSGRPSAGPRSSAAARRRRASSSSSSSSASNRRACAVASSSASPSPRPSPGRIWASAARAAGETAPRTRGRRRGPAGAARRRSARRAARPPPARRSRRRSRATPSARAARSSSLSRRVLPTPDSPATNASDGRPVGRLGERGAQLLELGRPADEAGAGHARGHDRSIAPPAAGSRGAGSGGGGEGGGHASIVACAARRHIGRKEPMTAVALLTPRTSTPYRARSCTEAPYGTWRSPIDGDAVARDRGWTYSLVTVAGGAVYWSEARPLEDGRDAIVVAAAGRAPGRRDPAPAAAPARACTSTAAARTPSTTARVYFCHDADQRIHRLAPGGEPEPITPPGARYADLQRDAGRPLARVRARARRRSRARQRPRRAPDRRLGGAAGDRLRPRLLLLAARLARRDADRLAGLGPPADAVGGLDCGRELADVGGARLVAGGAGRGDRAARVEPGRRAALQLGPHRLVEPLPRRGRRAADRDRGRDRRAAVGVRRVAGTRSSTTGGSSARTSATAATTSRSSTRRSCATCRSSSRGSST